MVEAIYAIVLENNKWFNLVGKDYPEDEVKRIVKEKTGY